MAVYIRQLMILFIKVDTENMHTYNTANLKILIKK